MPIITIIDYLLLPVYLYLFYIIVRKQSFKYTDADIRRFFFTAFWLRMFGSIAYSMLVQYYYGYGDSFTYYAGGDFLRGQLMRDAGNIKYFFASAEEVRRWYDFEDGNVGYAGYFGVTSNLFVMKIAALISFLAFNKFLIISVFFGLFSFAGQWRLFKVFNEVNKGKYVKILAIAVLYTPSIWFWGSGLMKDSICIGGVGFIIYYLYELFVKKNYSFKSILVLAFMVYLVVTTKSYIIIILAVSLSGMVFLNLIAVFKNVIVKAFVLIIFLFLAISFAYVSNFGAQLQNLAEESKAQVDTFRNNYDALQKEEENSRAGLKSEEIDASLSGMILHSPVAIFTCMFRPFPWESRKIMILLTSLESMLLLFSTLFLIYKLGLFRFFNAIFADPYILFSFLISMLFALIIGFTTFNFGTMVRYKIILMPFYYFMLVRLYGLVPQKKPLLKET